MHISVLYLREYSEIQDTDKLIDIHVVLHEPMTFTIFDSLGQDFYCFVFAVFCVCVLGFFSQHKPILNLFGFQRYKGIYMNTIQYRCGYDKIDNSKSQVNVQLSLSCLLYTSDAADDMQCVDLGGRRIIKKREVGWNGLAA